MNIDSNRSIVGRVANLHSAKRTGLLARFVALLCTVIFLASCSTTPTDRDRVWTSGIAVMGVTSKSGLTTAFNRNRMAADFASMLVETGKFKVLPAVGVRQLIGASAYQSMMNHYARTGTLTAQDLAILRQSGLPMSRIVLARLENDYVSELPERKEVLFNDNGAVMFDRQRSVFGIQRVSTLSAIVIDIESVANKLAAAVSGVTNRKKSIQRVFGHQLHPAVWRRLYQTR